MKQAATDLLERLASGRSVSFDQLLWVSLIIGLMFASVHLITMLATRWGDRQAMTKSLLFSLLVHVSCALGLVAFNPPPQRRYDPASEEEEKVEVRMLFVEGEERIETDDPGNTPIWEKISDPKDVQLTRLERSPVEPTPLESPIRQPEPMTPPEIDVPDLPSLPDEPVATPQPDHRGEVGMRQEVAIPLEIDDPTAEARPEVSIPSSSTVRTPLPREGQIETQVDRESNRGAIDRVETRFEPTRQLASLDADADPSAFLKRNQEQDAVRRRVGPVPSPVDAIEPGTAAPDRSEGSAEGSPLPPRTTRRRTSPPQSRNDGTIERHVPERTPQSVDAQNDDPVHVRESLPIPVLRVGPSPNVTRPNFESVVTRDDTKIPPTYRLRNLARREEIAREFGGTEESERAVEASLRWLALHQSRLGYWDADRFGSGQVEFDEVNNVNREFAGKYADTGVTALAVLAYLGAGYTHEEGKYAPQVDAALRWLVSQQIDNGSIGSDASRFARNYCHAMATFALAEAYGMQSDPTTDTRLRKPIAKAVAYILDQQNPEDGGWRYVKKQESDMSMFGWQLMALKSAEIAGFPIPADARQKMVRFLKDRSLGERKGLAAYRLGTPKNPPTITPAMTAEALFCKQMLGILRTNAASEEAVEYLLAHPPKRSELNLYYWYYGTLAMYQYGGEPWRDWNESVRDQLIAEQRKSGDEAGSWDPKGPWGPYGGRIYATALSTLCLEVYYRFLPLYQMGGRYSQEQAPGK